MNSLRPSDDQLPRAGEVVAGKYRIESVIGTGGMGVVLGAQDTSLGRRVAIKFLAPHKAQNEDAVARFLREARAAASLQSEHVVRVFEVGSLPNGASYIVMEHLQGRDLAQLLHARGPLPIEEAVDFVIEACEAIGEAHGKGIVHRDLKPQNLFVATLPDGSPSVKVLDFGISKAVDEASANLTATDTVMGTPLYMSPEQVRSLKSVDLRSDIWALGAILFELLTAAPIYHATTVSALCAMIAMDPPIPLRAKRPNAPPALEALISRCLHKDPAGRFQDVAALSDALAPFATDRGRMSAMRVAGVVRAGGGAAPLMPSPHDMATGSYGGTGAPGMGPPGMGPTGAASSAYSSQLPPPPSSMHLSGQLPLPPGSSPAGVSNYPPGAMPPMHTSSQFAAGPRATHDGWQQQTGAIGPGTIAQRRAGSGLYIVFGVVGGLFLLAIIAGAGVYLVSQRKGDDAASNQADAAAPIAAAAPTTAAPVASAPPATGAAPANPGGSKKAAATKDAGGSAAPSNGPAPAAPANPDDDPARLARLKQIAQGRCSLQQGELSRNDASNSGARNVKNQACLQASSLSPNSGSANCERANCRTACTILKDQICLLQLDQAERSNPLKF